MSNLQDKYPDTFQVGEDSFNKTDALLEDIEKWKDGRFQEQLQAFKARFDEDDRIALVIRELEAHGMTIGLPDSKTLNSMFALIEDSACLIMHYIMNEDVRL